MRDSSDPSDLQREEEQWVGNDGVPLMSKVEGSLSERSAEFGLSPGVRDANESHLAMTAPAFASSW